MSFPFSVNFCCQFPEQKGPALIEELIDNHATNCNQNLCILHSYTFSNCHLQLFRTRNKSIMSYLTSSDMTKEKCQRIFFGFLLFAHFYVTNALLSAHVTISKADFYCQRKYLIKVFGHLSKLKSMSLLLK